MTHLSIARRLATAGLFAVAQGSMDSAINALASSAVADIYIPLKRMRRAQRPTATLAASPPGFPVVGVDYAPDDTAPVPEEEKPTDAPKIAVALMGVIMTLFAIACAYAYDPKSKGFLDFALGVMTFAFSGMLAVFLTGLAVGSLLVGLVLDRLSRRNQVFLFALLEIAIVVTKLVLFLSAPEWTIWTTNWFINKLFVLACFGLMLPWLALRRRRQHGGAELVDSAAASD